MIQRLQRWFRHRRPRPFDWAEECPEMALPPETYVRLVASSAHPRELAP